MTSTPSNGKQDSNSPLGFSNLTIAAIEAIKILQKKGLAIDTFRDLPVSKWIDVATNPVPPDDKIGQSARSRVIQSILSDSLKAVCEISDDGMVIVLADA